MSEATRMGTERRIANYQKDGRRRLTAGQWRRVEHKRMLGHHGGKSVPTPRQRDSR